MLVCLYELHGVVQYGLSRTVVPFPKVGTALEPSLRLQMCACVQWPCIQGVFMNYMLVSKSVLLL